jgi:hypothetical protein
MGEACDGCGPTFDFQVRHAVVLGSNESDHVQARFARGHDSVGYTQGYKIVREKFS